MSRTRNKVTKSLPGIPIEEKITRCQYGDKYNAEALEAFGIIFHAAALDCGGYGKLTEEQEKQAALYKKTAWRLVCKIFLTAHEKNSGDFLREMAYMLEHQFNAVDPERAVVAVQIEAAKAFSLPLPTIPVLMAMTGKDKRSIGRMLDELELKAGKAERGGDRKSKAWRKRKIK